MAGENGLNRRQFLATSGAAFLGGTMALQEQRPNLSIEITLTEALADRAEKEKGYREYPAAVMNSFLVRSLQSLLPSRFFQGLEILYNPVEPDVTEETAEATLDEWKQVSKSDHSSKLLITDRKYPDAVGVAERTSDPFDSCCAVLGEGYDLLDLEETDWQERVVVNEYVEEEFSHELNYDPLKTVVAGEHEAGHTLGLEHEDGELYEVDEGVVLSTMGASYLEEHAETSDVRYSDDIYWSPIFSNRAQERLQELLENSGKTPTFK